MPPRISSKCLCVATKPRRRSSPRIDRPRTGASSSATSRPGFSLHVEEKLALARALDALGVDIMEAGFPIASPKDAEAVRRVATEIRRPTIAALARCRRLDLEKTFWALEPAAKPRVHIVLATSDLHLEKKLNMTRSQCIDAAAESVRLARAHVDDVEFSAEDALRS